MDVGPVGELTDRGLTALEDGTDLAVGDPERFVQHEHCTHERGQCSSTTSMAIEIESATSARSATSGSMSSGSGTHGPM